MGQLRVFKSHEPRVKATVMLRPATVVISHA